MDATKIGLHYLQVAHHVRRTVDDRLAADGVSLSRLKLLQAIDQLEPVTQAALAVELDQAPRSITQAVETLERDGLIHRADSPTDRRAKQVTLTSAGRAALKTAVRSGEAALQDLFGALSRSQLTALTAALTTIESQLQS